jgi:hypothetical protein
MGPVLRGLEEVRHDHRHAGTLVGVHNRHRRARGGRARQGG